MSTTPIAEIFGPTIQGEGALVGRPTYFVRVGGCDFSCIWCDSGHAVLAPEVRKLPRLTEDEIIARLAELVLDTSGTAEWLTISGGNPALYELSDLVKRWQSRFAGKVAVETQGSRWKDWLGNVDLLTISPKPPSSKMLNGVEFDAFMRQAAVSDADLALKVVVFDEADYLFAKSVHESYPEVAFYLSCGTAMGGLSGEWLLPGSTDLVDTKESLLARFRWLVERALQDEEMADAAILPQLHVLTWGPTTRGV